MPTMVHGLPTHGGETGGVVTVTTDLVRDTMEVVVDVADALTMLVDAEVDAQAVVTTVWDEMSDSASVVVLIFKLIIVKIKSRK